VLKNNYVLSWLKKQPFFGRASLSARAIFFLTAQTSASPCLGLFSAWCLVQHRELRVSLHEIEAFTLPKLDAFMWSCYCFEILLSVQGVSWAKPALIWPLVHAQCVLKLICLLGKNKQKGHSRGRCKGSAQRQIYT